MSIEFTNPHQLEKIRRLEGMRNPSDIWDLDIFENIRAGIKTKEDNIQENFTECELSSEQTRCLEKIKSFCNELSREFKGKFLSLLEQYKDKNSTLSPNIVNYLLERKLILPSLIITHGDKSRKFLDEYGLDNKISDQNLMLVLQLPKPLAQYWWKGGAESWGNKAKKVGEMIIEWGHFYRELMPIIWETQGRYENEGGLDFCRINNIGEHDPKKYYYIWEISEWAGKDRWPN